MFGRVLYTPLLSCVFIWKFTSDSQTRIPSGKWSLTIWTNPWNTSAMGSQYSKIKFTYDSLYKNKSPLEIYSWDFLKCWLKNDFRKCWKIFIIDFDPSIAFDRSLHSFITIQYSIFAKQKHSIWECLKKINNWIYLAVNGLVDEFLCLHLFSTRMCN